MHKNNFVYVPLGLRSTASGTKAGTAVGWDIGEPARSFLLVGVASAFPNYTSRGPTLNLYVYNNLHKPDLFGIRGGVSTVLAFNCNYWPSTSKAWTTEITQYALGRVGILANLVGASGATARATYAVTVVNRY